MALNIPQNESTKTNIPNLNPKISETKIEKPFDFKKARSHYEGNLSFSSSLKAVKEQFGDKLQTHEQYKFAHRVANAGNVNGEKMAKIIKDMAEQGEISKDRAKYISKSANLPNI